eukprot:763174-Hanusia_phi.AAC.3
MIAATLSLPSTSPFLVSKLLSTNSQPDAKRTDRIPSHVVIVLHGGGGGVGMTCTQGLRPLVYSEKEAENGVGWHRTGTGLTRFAPPLLLPSSPLFLSYSSPLLLSSSAYLPPLPTLSSPLLISPSRPLSLNNSIRTASLDLHKDIAYYANSLKRKSGTYYTLTFTVTFEHE